MISDLYRQSWLRFLLAVVAGLGGGLSGAGVIRLVSSAVSHAAPQAILAAGFFGCVLLQLLFRILSQWLLTTSMQAIVCRLRVELCRDILLTPYKTVEGLGKSRLLAILTADIDTFTQAAQLMPVIMGGSVVIVVCLGYLAWLSWPVFVFFTLFLLAGCAIYYVLERLPRQAMTQVRDQLDVVYQHFRSLLDGTRELQLNSARAAHFVDEVVAPSAQRFRVLLVRGLTGYTIVNNAGGMLFYLMIGLFLFVAEPSLRLPSATVVTITFLLMYLIQPIADLMTALPSLRQSSIALDRIRQLKANLVVSARASVAAAAPDPFPRAATDASLIRLEAVRHRFPGLTDDQPFMLGPIDLEIRSGELLFVVGGNGSGKTTLAMLLLGLYEPESGTIRLNGVPVTDANVRHYRQRFSAIFSDFHLFQEFLGTQSRHVTEQAAHYLNALGLAHKVRLVGGQFTTTSLSSGQRKRMALVSAYLEDRSVYVLDEWAADQDPAFKRVFYTELLPELQRRGKTLIVISHDDAYFHLADRIVRLSEGRIVAEPHIPGRNAAEMDAGVLR